MEDYNSTSLPTDPTQALGGLLGGSGSSSGSGQSLIPESLVTFMIVAFVIINILTIVFMVYWVMGMVRRWKVQTAILHMQKDIAEIKDSLAKQAANEPVSQESKPATTSSNSTEPDTTTEPKLVNEATVNEPPKPKSDSIASSNTPTNQIS